MGARRIRKLGSLDTQGVSLVDRGANMKRFAIAKREAETVKVDAKYLKLLMDVIEKGDMPTGHEDGSSEFDKLYDGLDDAGKETLKAIGKLYAAQKDSEAFKGALGKMLGLPGQPGAPATKDAEGASAGDGKAGGPKAEKAGVEASEEGDGTGEEEETEMSKSVKKALADQQTVIKALQADLKKTRDDARKAEWVAKAERELAYVPGKTSEQLGEMLFNLEQADKSMASTQFEVFKSLSAQMKDITRARGYVGETPFKGGAQADAWQEIMKSATGDRGQLDAAMTVVKSRDGFAENVKYMKADQITKAAEFEAVASFILANPAMYDSYLAEHPHQTRVGPPR